MSINSLNFNATLTAVEQISVNSGSLSTLKNLVTHGAFDVAKILNGSTTPAVSDIAEFVATLSAGALTIDCTALVGTNGRIVDGTGKKIRFIRITNLGANVMTLATGGSNPQTVGTGILIHPGCTVLLEYIDALAAIDSTHKNLSLTGTGTQTANVSIILG